MRKEIILSNWLFHKGDIEVPKPVVKGQIYAQSKTERKLSGPAAYNYLDNPDPFYPAKTPHSDRWERVTIPHDYVVTQDLSKDENNATRLSALR